MTSSIIGWDVGGANLKAAGIGDDPSPEPVVVERPFRLWREPERLPVVLTEIAAGLGGASSRMAITMTAELADCFATRRDGVRSVIDAFRRAFPGVELAIYGTDGRFRSVPEALRVPLDVAAANWIATATLAARTFSDAILIDVGSTTTDIIPIAGGRVAATARTDAGRLVAGELVYTGALRTPVCAVVRWVPLGDRLCRVAAEHFATAADAYLWLGRIEERDYTSETSDGRGRSRPEAGARLARMVCADIETLGEDEITAIAGQVARAQARQIAGGIRQVRRRLGPSAPSTALVAGGGGFLARDAAEAAGLEVRELADLIGRAAARAAPAAAVAYLLAEGADSG